MDRPMDQAILLLRPTTVTTQRRTRIIGTRIGDLPSTSDSADAGVTGVAGNRARNHWQRLGVDNGLAETIRGAFLFLCKSPVAEAWRVTSHRQSPRRMQTPAVHQSPSPASPCDRFLPSPKASLTP